ncbi:MAG: alpha-L-fucosidase [Candidatus Borkfalkiaceae bacterium]|nr:alpha-L-fucosidase [Christensenellaceae bacterium]
MNRDFGYVARFEKFGFGMFVHFGLYSLLAKGEWTYRFDNVPEKEYEALSGRFDVKKDFAKEIVSAAKKAGCRYVTLTTRHHDGFSLYDTRGLSDYDVVHTPTGRDLVREFVDECRAQGLLPFFYHTLLDWHDERYRTDFKAYLRYLRKSIELLCTEYGEVGGFWFDGMWDRPEDSWEEDELYAVIRKHLPNAMIINNTGLSFQGKVGHYELDSVTFERGKPVFVDNSDRPRAGEMCQIMNNNWGYSAVDISFKSVESYLTDLTDCRKFGCNYLLNVGPKGDGSLSDIEKGILEQIGKWVSVYGESVYDVTPLSIDGEDFVLRGKNCDYFVVHGLQMIANDNLNIVKNAFKRTETEYSGRIAYIEWIDNGEKLQFRQNGNRLSVVATHFPYGYNYCVRVARIIRK